MILGQLMVARERRNIFFSSIATAELHNPSSMLLSGSHPNGTHWVTRGGEGEGIVGKINKISGSRKRQERDMGVNVFKIYYLGTG